MTEIETQAPQLTTVEGPDTSDWFASLTRTVVHIEATGAKIVGIASERATADAGLIAEALKATSSRFGKRVLLVNPAEVTPAPRADGARAFGPGSTPAAAPDDRPVERSLGHLSMEFRKQFARGREDHDLILVVLPPAGGPSGPPDPIFLAAGRECETVLLICLTGETTHADLKNCLEICQASNVIIGGLILNDRKVAFSRLLQT